MGEIGLLIRLFNWFTKITAWPLQLLIFRTKVYYEDKSVQSRRIKGPAIIISNHTALFDYAAFLFVFFGRTLRYQMAEVLFKKPGLSQMLKCLGGVFVDRDSHNFGFVNQSLELLDKGWVLGIFPESRLPLPDEERPLPFKPSAAYIALESGVPVIPVYTNGCYFTRKRARVLIGKPIDVRALAPEGLSERETLDEVSRQLRGKIIELRDELERKTAR